MDSAQGQFQSGLALLRQNQVQEALTAFQQAARLAPKAAPAHHMIGIALHRLGRVREAEKAISKAIAIDGSKADYFSNRSLMHCGLEQFRLAIADAETAVRLDPRHAGALCNLGLAHIAAKDYVAAADAFTRLIEIAPDFGQGYENLALAISNIPEPSATLVAAQAFVAVAPKHAAAHFALGRALVLVGESQAAAAALRRAIEIGPDSLKSWSELLFLTNYLDGISGDDRLAASQGFSRAVMRGIAPKVHFPRADAADKALRVGFVSGDLREHSVSQFLMTALPALRERGLSLAAYTTVSTGDAVTDELKSVFDVWRDIAELSDEAAAGLIGGDGIDILFDLSGHSSGRRQRLFALRPAPLSVLWLGYSATSANPAIDYVLCDDRVLPEEEERYFTEKPLRLPHGFLCFTPPRVDAPPLVDAVPLTFGSFNTLHKLSGRTVALWSQILQAVPGSTLLLKARELGSEATRQRTADRFAAHGIDPARIVMLPRSATRSEHLALYGRLHVALDPWPYSGTTTTMEALSMGVPVLTLNEGAFVSRVSASLLAEAGLDEWIAGSADDYVEKAVAAASSPQRLADLRPIIRSKLAQSRLYDAESFAADFEHAMRRIWRQWCAGVGKTAD